MIKIVSKVTVVIALCIGILTGCSPKHIQSLSPIETEEELGTLVVKVRKTPEDFMRMYNYLAQDSIVPSYTVDELQYQDDRDIGFGRKNTSQEGSPGIYELLSLRYTEVDGDVFVSGVTFTYWNETGDNELVSYAVVSAAAYLLLSFQEDSNRMDKVKEIMQKASSQGDSVSEKDEYLSYYCSYRPDSMSYYWNIEYTLDYLFQVKRY